MLKFPNAERRELVIRNSTFRIMVLIRQKKKNQGTQCGDRSRANPPSPTPNKILLFSAQNITANWLTKFCEKPQKTKRYIIPRHFVHYFTRLVSDIISWLGRRPCVIYPPSHIGIKQLNVCHITAHGRQPWQGLFRRLDEKLGREKREPITEVHTGGGAFAGLCLGSRWIPVECSPYLLRMWNVDNSSVYHLRWLCWFAAKRKQNSCKFPLHLTHSWQDSKTQDEKQNNVVMAQQTWECRRNVSKIFNSRFSIFKGAQSFILARIQGAYNDVYM